jgi:putative PIN family toxin of toxin-antitoxin system
MPTRRYFLDANILVSGLVWDGNERELLKMGERKELQLVSSIYVFRELQDVFEGFGFERQKIAESMVYLRSFLELVDATEEDVKEYWGCLGDKGDVPVLAAAIRSKCILVTGDKQLKKVARGYLRVESARDILDLMR